MENPNETNGKVLEIMVSIGERIKPGKRIIKIESAKEATKEKKAEKKNRPESKKSAQKTRVKEKVSYTMSSKTK